MRPLIPPDPARTGRRRTTAGAVPAAALLLAALATASTATATATAPAAATPEQLRSTTGGGIGAASYVE